MQINHWVKSSTHCKRCIDPLGFGICRWYADGGLIRKFPASITMSKINITSIIRSKQILPPCKESRRMSSYHFLHSSLDLLTVIVAISQTNRSLQSSILPSSSKTRNISKRISLRCLTKSPRNSSNPMKPSPLWLFPAPPNP